MKYTIYGISDGDRIVYVGCTNNLDRRTKEHLQLKTHTKVWLKDLFKVKIIVLCEADNKDEAISLEDHYILVFDTIENGYNHYRSGTYSKGSTEYFKLREHTKKRQEYKKKYRSTDEYKARKKEIDRRYYLKKKMKGTE